MIRLKNVVLVAVTMLVLNLMQPLKVSAQVVDPGCDPLDPTCPIDGGLSLLIAAGIGIGAKKAYDRKKKNIAEY